jgi:integral membrane protein (TIGR01906 family)
VSRLAGVGVGAATALVIVAVAIVPFLTPVWLGFAQDRAEATAWTGWPAASVRAATDALVGDLISGQGDFDAVIDGEPVLSERERAHMRDVRGVFRAFYVAALVGAVVLFVGLRDARMRAGWRAVRAGAFGLAAGIVAAGVVVAVAFDAAFAVFHGLFFSAGSWTFDPRTDRLVQLFPERFWVETTIGVGAIGFVFALGVARVAGRRS